MYVFVCVMLCLFFVTVQYFDMFCFYFGLQQQQQFAWPSTLQQSTAWLLSLSVSRTAVLSFNDLTVRYSVCSSQFTISNCFISQKHKKAHRQKAKKPKKKQLNLFIFSLHSFCGIFFSYIFLYSLIPFSR